MIGRKYAWLMLASALTTGATWLGALNAIADSEVIREQTAWAGAPIRATAMLDPAYRRIVWTNGFAAADGYPVRYRIYRYLGREKGIVVFLNGRSEFIEKYDVLFTARHEFPKGPAKPAQTLADLPFTFVTMDYEGQGGSVAGRIPSHIADFDLFVEDLETLFERVPALRWHLSPVYLMGHSMGGLVAARFAQENPDRVDGLILSSPMLGMLAPNGLTVEQLAGVAAFYASPSPYGLGLDKLCTSPPGLDRGVLVAIAACHGDARLKSCFDDPRQSVCGSLTECLIYGYPNDCGMPPIDFAGLRSALEYLKRQPEGCPIDPSDIAGCPYADLGMDKQYCRYVFGHRLHTPDFTFGWLNRAFAAQAELYAGKSIALPTLILSDPNDQVVDASTHVCAPPISDSGSCFVTTYTDFGHELLAASKRAKPIADIREVLIDWSE